MEEASWAAAGMLAGDDPEHPPALSALAHLSIQLYPEYLRAIERLSGRTVRLRTHAALQVGAGPGHSIGAEEARRRVPGLVTDGASLWWMEEASLDPRDLCVALPAAVEAAGVDLRLQTEVLSVSTEAGGVVLSTRTGRQTAGAFVNCCGAWAGQIVHAGSGLAAAASVEPRKGQMLTVRLDPPLDLPYVVRTPEIYLVPRGNGEVVVGATVERAGFDRSLDPAALERLRGLAAAVWPPIASGTVCDSWSGLRPGTPDTLPLIGGTGEPGCWVATGHFRNGIMLAPATALVVRQLLQGTQPSVALDAFAPGR